MVAFYPPCRRGLALREMLEREPDAFGDADLGGQGDGTVQQDINPKWGTSPGRLHGVAVGQVRSYKAKLEVDRSSGEGRLATV